MGKRENAVNQYFLLLPQCFLLYRRKIATFEHIEIVICKCFQFGESQIILLSCLCLALFGITHLICLISKNLQMTPGIQMMGFKALETIFLFPAMFLNIEGVYFRIINTKTRLPGKRLTFFFFFA